MFLKERLARVNYYVGHDHANFPWIDLIALNDDTSALRG